MTNLRLYLIAGLLVGILFITPMIMGINDAGMRTVVQYPSGTLYVKFEPGFYWQWFGTITDYKDVHTLDYSLNPQIHQCEGIPSKAKDESDHEISTLNQYGISVRYQDGGTGTIYGIARFALPGDEPTMLQLHRDFRSNDGVAQKLIQPLTGEAMNLTAGLMSSEEAYTEKRGTFTQWAQQQVEFGKFQTELKQVSDLEEGTGKRVLKNIPVIKFGEDGLPIHLMSDFKKYGITVKGFQITDWDFECKTLEQIAAKRKATMAIITAKADAERAKQDAITAEEEGKASVMKAKYEKEVEKERAVVDAKRVAEVAVIGAVQKVDVATQEKLQAEQKKLAAAEYKLEQILRGEGDGAYRQKVMEANGALEQKLATYETVMGKFAEEFGKQKWTPEIQMGTQTGQGGNTVDAFIDLLTTKTAKDLALDMSVTAKQ